MALHVISVDIVEHSNGRGLKRASDHKAKQREAMITRILDAAERLFAEFGFHGVTLRDIAAAVGVGPTLVHYHFAGKEAVFDAVWARRAPISAQGRLKAMDDYAQKAAGNITVEGALNAWLDHDLILVAEGGTGWLAFGMVASQANGAAGWGAEKMNEHFNPVVLALIELLKIAMPECDERTLFWGYHFLQGAIMNNFAQTGRLDTLSGGACRSSDLRAIRWHLATFMAAGFRAICAQPPFEETLVPTRPVEG